MSSERGLTELAASRDPSRKVRLVERADVLPLVQMLVRAYMDDPVAIWMCPSEQLRARTLAALYAARLQRLQGHGSVWTDLRRLSVAVWMAPNCQRAAPRLTATLLRCLLDPSLLARVPVLGLGMHTVGRAHPKHPPHWYLSLLGTNPEMQGKGLGSAVLGPVLERCDREGVGAYLESSKLANLDFYARFGFMVTGELRLPGNGPTLWPMWRAPRKIRRG